MTDHLQTSTTNGFLIKEIGEKIEYIQSGFLTRLQILHTLLGKNLNFFPLIYNVKSPGRNYNNTLQLHIKL